MGFLEDWKKKQALQKKVSQAKEDQQVKQDSRQYTKLGLSQDEAEFLARQEIKSKQSKDKLNRVFGALEGVASKLEVPDQKTTQQQPEKEPKNKKQQKQDQKKSIDSAVTDSFFYKI
ncbi:MAG: hypothetical protein ACC612_11470 [Methanomethylovorans sp.]|uniref:hypothetical protein n=1 Tax=Methanomethylovorans sp. TaxID=2758717 RepID=UPI0035313BEC